MEVGSATNQRQKYTLKQILHCLIPSLIGGFCFMCPVPYGDGGLVIPITYLIKGANVILDKWLIASAVAITCLSAILSILASAFKVKTITQNKLLSDVFDVKWYWIVPRVLGAIFAVMVFWEVGPEQIISGDTGKFILNDLLSGVLTIGIIAGGILPLMVEFGLMEYIGTIVGPIFKRVFRIPGRSAVDCISSWLGDTSVAVILTNGQLEKGYYTEREACVIASTFSAVSITFALVVIEEVGFLEHFLPFYGTVCLVGIACAIIMPRIPPLSRKADNYITKSIYEGESYSAPGYNLLQWAWNRAVNKACNNGYTYKSYFTDWAKNSLTMLFMLTPMVMCIGTLALMLATYTPVLEWLGYPFMPLLNLLQVPEASGASRTMVAGFADMFLPAIIASRTITSPYTRFLVAVISITQLIFISENGSMILSTRIPLNMFDLFIIFLERTVISVIVASLFIRFVLQIPLV